MSVYACIQTGIVCLSQEYSHTNAMYCIPKEKCTILGEGPGRREKYNRDSMKQKLTEKLRHKRLLRDRRTRTVAFCAERKRAEGRGQNAGLAQGGNRQCGAL